ncbi:MAG: Branched-chain alpha-keto acid dehydrogenase, E1 component, beta subunit [uncultured Thermomicrobiales bacterium]|uniref:Branched-chain alpha-keto acid dehydrogenase, E1 component, beta subunit n=1 Tax=uncultured Thermomicrobiales bacterium TaxID=1645740 RepID=A0A6J4UIM0_9BACT|nr:MAG: Branched-chain alpha-keto acid dehydrogenase, E1 component, beta subunit [uncultured Thermomicrobiales bacterium]
MVQAPERPAVARPAGDAEADEAPQRSFIEAIHDTLHEEMRADERIVVLGEDVGRRGGVFRVTEGLLAEFGEGRVIDTPLAESGIIGSAIGMALNGLRPVAEIQFLDFIHSAMDQLMNEAARLRYRSNNDVCCPLVVRVPFGGGVHGALYHSQSIEAVFVHTPGLKVVAPATPADARGLLRAAIRDDDPVLFLEHKRMYRLIKGSVPPGPHEVPLGRARVAREGSDATIVTYGFMVHEAEKAAAAAAERGASVEVIDLRSLKPLDEAAVIASAKKTGKALVVAEANRPCSVASEVAALIAEEAFAYLDAPVMRVAGPDVPAMPFSPPLEKAFLVDAEKIGAALGRLLAY